MGNETGKRPVRRDPPLQEWISDNLRYIILFAVIAAVVIILLFILGIFQSGSDGAENASSAESSTRTIQESSSTVSEDTDKTADASDENTGTKAAVTPKPSPSVTPAPVKAEEKDGTGLTKAESPVRDIISAYFAALGSADTEAAEAVTESISESDRAAITNGAYMRDYDDIRVWTGEGEEPGESVAFVSYTYTYPGYETRIPALTVLYIVKGEDGTPLIASEETEARKAQTINEALEDSDVKELRSEISGLYDQALASDPALAEYIASLG